MEDEKKPMHEGEEVNAPNMPKVKMRIGIDKEEKIVALSFEPSLSMLAMSKDEALRLGQSLIENALKL